MRAISICLVLSLCSSAVFGQIANFHTFSGQPLMVDKPYYKDVEGTPYFNPDWRMGAIIYDNKRIENVQLKYNAYEDNVVVYYNDKPFIPDERLVKGFEFTQNDELGIPRHYQFRNGFEASGLSKKEYLSVIYEGKLVLAEKIRVDEISVTPAVYGQAQVKRFVMKRGFILIRNGAAEKISLSKRSLLKEFPDQTERLKRYFKENPIDFKDRDEVIQLMTFIDNR